MHEPTTLDRRPGRADDGQSAPHRGHFGRRPSSCWAASSTWLETATTFPTTRRFSRSRRRCDRSPAPSRAQRVSRSRNHSVGRVAADCHARGSGRVVGRRFCPAARLPLRDGHALRAGRVVLQHGAWISRPAGRSRGETESAGPARRFKVSTRMAACAIRKMTLAWPSQRRGSDRSTVYTSPLRTAHTAACVRSETPILRRMCCTCSLTVS